MAAALSALVIVIVAVPVPEAIAALPGIAPSVRSTHVLLPEVPSSRHQRKARPVPAALEVNVAAPPAHVIGGTGCAAIVGPMQSRAMRRLSIAQDSSSSD